MRAVLAGFVCAVALSARAQLPAGDFLQGPLRATGVTTDLAIDGAGFFVLRGEADPAPRFTREGKFRLDSRTVLVALDGRPVLAFGVDDGQPNGRLGPVSLANLVMPPRATSRISVNANLDPAAALLPTPFDHLAPQSTGNFQTGIRVFDSLGTARIVQIYFRKTGTPNRWEWYAGAERRAFDMPALGMAQGPSGAQGQFIVAQSGLLTFGYDGVLLSRSDAPLSIPRDADGNGVLDPGTAPTAQAWPWADGAAIASVALDFGTPVSSGGTGADGATQFGGGSFLRMVDQDGYASGVLQALTIDIDGSLLGAFSNGQSMLLAQIALAIFPGSYWLERIDDTRAYEATERSGAPVYGAPQHGAYGMIRSGFLEDLCETPQRLCDTLPPLELCEQKLAECEASGRLDADQDGEPDVTDHCPDTPRFADVDTAGCSQQQFCTGIDVRGSRDRLRCTLSDWKNDEPTSISPRDCAILAKRSGRPVCSAPR